MPDRFETHTDHGPGGPWHVVKDRMGGVLHSFGNRGLAIAVAKYLERQTEAEAAADVSREDLQAAVQAAHDWAVANGKEAMAQEAADLLATLTTTISLR